MIISVDLDDTLLDTAKNISKFNKKILLKAKKAGHKIVISTLRPPSRCLDFAKEIKADFLSCVLSQIITDSNGKILKSMPIAINSFDDLIKDFESVYSDCWIGFENETVSVVSDENLAKVYKGLKLMPKDEIKNIIISEPVYKISFGCDNINTMQKYVELAKKYGLNCRTAKSEKYVDLTTKNCDKVDFLKELKQKYPDEQLIVFGDDITDIKSIEFADIGVAMANSKPEVFEVATHTTLTNNEDGVGKFLEKYLKK